MSCMSSAYDKLMTYVVLFKSNLYKSQACGMQKACGKQITCDKVVQYKLHVAFSLGSRGYFFSLIIL